MKKLPEEETLKALYKLTEIPSYWVMQLESAIADIERIGYTTELRMGEIEVIANVFLKPSRAKKIIQELERMRTFYRR